ncbi:MAG: NAD(P)H-dependent oxidoreductase subunit E, partial [Alphaproteobacteria bacterium]
VCTNCACMVRGSDAILQAVKEHTGITHLNDHHQGHSTCGTFTLTEVECLGACVDAPMMQITATNGSSHYYTKLDAKQTKQILKDLKSKGVSSLAETTPSPIDPITGGEYAA